MAEAHEAKKGDLVTIDGYHGHVDDAAIEVRYWGPNRIRLTVGRSELVETVFPASVAPVQDIKSTQWRTRRYLLPWRYPIEIHDEPQEEAP